MRGMLTCHEHKRKPHDQPVPESGAVTQQPGVTTRMPEQLCEYGRHEVSEPAENWQLAIVDKSDGCLLSSSTGLVGASAEGRSAESAGCNPPDLSNGLKQRSDSGSIMLNCIPNPEQAPKVDKTRARRVVPTCIGPSDCKKIMGTSSSLVTEPERVTGNEHDGTVIDVHSSADGHKALSQGDGIIQSGEAEAPVRSDSRQEEDSSADPVQVVEISVTSGAHVTEVFRGALGGVLAPTETVLDDHELTGTQACRVTPCKAATISTDGVVSPVSESNPALQTEPRSGYDNTDVANGVDSLSLEEAVSRSSSDGDTKEEDIPEEDDGGESEDSYHNSEVSLKEEDVIALMEQLVEAESEAASIQESLEEESLLRVRTEVAAELAEALSEDKLESAVEEEMSTYVEHCEDMLEQIEEKSALLQEKLEDAGVSLTHLFKWIEKQTPEGSTTEAWKKRTLWVGHQPTEEMTSVLSKASEELKLKHPARSHRGKILDEGASGFLERKLASEGEVISIERTSMLEVADDDGWSRLEEFLDNDDTAGPGLLMGTKRWAAVYLASTPEQAAQLGLTLPGVDTVEEIGDVETEKRTIFKAALKNEGERGLTEAQKKSIKKVREEDDVRKIRRRQRRTGLKYLKSKQVNTTLTEPCRLSSENIRHTPTSGVPTLGFQSSSQISERASQPSIAAGIDRTLSGQSRPKWKSDDLPDVIELLSDDEDTGDLESAGKQQPASLCKPSACEVVPGESPDPVVKLQSDENKVLPQLLNMREDARSGQTHEPTTIVGEPDLPVFEREADSALEGEHSSSRTSEILALQGLGKKRTFEEITGYTKEESSAKKPRLGEIQEENMFSTAGGSTKQLVPVYTPNRNYLVRTTVVIDSDGEREVEEAFTEPPTSSGSPSEQVAVSDKGGVCTVKIGCLKQEDESRHRRDIVLEPQGFHKAETSPEQLNGRKRKARLESDMRVKCTACAKVMKLYEVLRHPNPKLEVAVCRTCTKHYLSGPITKDQEDGTDSECSWCAEGGEVICCTRCDKVFCQPCISRNFGAKEYLRIVTDDYWLCFLCNASPLALLTMELEKAESELDRLLAGDRQVIYNDMDDSTKQEEAFVPIKHPKRGRHRRNIRKMLSDDELEEKQKELLAREKERQERLEHWQSVSSGPHHLHFTLRKPSQLATENTQEEHENLPKVTIVGLPINAARDPDEEAIFIAPSFAKVLKPHQIQGVRFMWQNCMESVKKVRSDPDGVGCILAHSMGLGKTLQVITFLHTVLSSDILWLKTALIVVPVNVLHNWRREFEMWQESLSNPVSVYVLDDSIRENLRRAQLLSSWHSRGGVMVMGYAAFRNLCVGKHVRDKALRDSFCESLQNPGPDILVCDEAHIIKNAKADITQTLKQVRSKRRVALTGSPLQNNLMEYYCMVDFVREGFLGPPAVFKNRFQNPIENGQHCDSTAEDVKIMKLRSTALYRHLKGFVQRMDSSVLKDELPPKVVYVISVRLSKFQRRLYEHYLQFHGILREADEAMENKTNPPLLFNAFHTLSKIWNHPDLLLLAQQEKIRKQQEDCVDEFGNESDEEKLSESEGVGASTLFAAEGKTKAVNRSFKKKGSKDPDELENSLWWKDIMEGIPREDVNLSGKMVLLLELLSMCAARGDKTLVFSQSLGTLDLIEKFMETRLFLPSEGKYWEYEKHWYRLDGNTPAGARMAMCENFNNPGNTDVKCVLISTRAGSLGINLPAANRVVIIDGSWNPVHDLQALFRAWRLGQKKAVFAYRFLACGTMEEKIYNRQVAKEGVAARVLDKSYPERIFSGDDLEYLFKLEPDVDDYASRESDGPLSVADKMPSAQSNTSRCLVSLGSTSKNKLASFLIPDDAPPVDDIMGKLLLDHRPCWVVRYHEHEPLLEHQEKEELTAEERQNAWETIESAIPNLGAPVLNFGLPVPNYFRPVALPYIPASQPEELPVVHSLASSSSRAVCSIKDHAALLNEHKVEVSQKILCKSCHQYISWNAISTPHKQFHRG